MQRSALCRSRRELSDEYLLAKIGVDTAENDSFKSLGENSIHYSFASLGREDRGFDLLHGLMAEVSSRASVAAVESPGRERGCAIVSGMLVAFSCTQERISGPKSSGSL